MKRILDVRPGERRINIFSGMPGGLSERVLQEVACPNPRFSYGSVENNERKFAPWCKGSTGTVYCRFDGCCVPLELKLGVREGLFLRDAPDSGCRMSFRWVWEGSFYVVDLPKLSEKDPRLSRYVRTIANQLVGDWLKGFDWVNTSGVCIKYPYGGEPQPKEPAHPVRRRRRQISASYMW
jgi:hypothetical protein